MSLKSRWSRPWPGEFWAFCSLFRILWQCWTTIVWGFCCCCFLKYELNLIITSACVSCFFSWRLVLPKTLYFHCVYKQTALLYIMCSWPLPISVALYSFRWSWSRESLLLLLFFFAKLKAGSTIWTYSAEYKDAAFSSCGDWTCKVKNNSHFYTVLVTRVKMAITCLCGICLGNIKDTEINVGSVLFFSTVLFSTVM